MNIITHMDKIRVKKLKTYCIQDISKCQYGWLEIVFHVSIVEGLTLS